ncbi:MAG: class I SAM-dependent methyltransferase [Pseudomonadota bacterium]|nr:class I SAM-dependent methyltransferase [Pseudomonadota bacterium]
MWSEPAFDLLRGVAGYTQNELVGSLAQTVARHPRARFDIAFNHKQIACKAWARDRLYETLGPRHACIWIAGGWYGVLAAMLFDDPRFEIGLICSLDIDPHVAPIAETLNAKAQADGRFRAATRDMFDLNYRGGELPTPSLVINTSSEHIADLGAWLALLPARQPVLLQSNNNRAEREHINCMPSLDAFAAAAQLCEVLFAGELPLKRYTRYMLIGRR